jgi:hypothetical protein
LERATHESIYTLRSSGVKISRRILTDECAPLSSRKTPFAVLAAPFAVKDSLVIKSSLVRSLDLSPLMFCMKRLLMLNLVDSDRMKNQDVEIRHNLFD